MRRCVARLVLSLLTLVSASAGVRAADAEAPDWDAEYVVAFTAPDGGPRTAQVHATLRWIGAAAAREDAVLLSTADDGFPGGYGAHVHPSGAPMGIEAVPDIQGRFNAPVEPDGRVRFRYDVQLDHDAAGWGAGPDEAPYAFDGGRFWTGRALFLTPERCRSVVRFTAATKGERVATSLAPADGKPGWLAAADESKLRDIFVVEGRFAACTISAGGAEVTLAFGPSLEASLPRVATRVSAFLEAATATCGPAAARRVLVVGNRHAGGAAGRSGHAFDGGVFGSDVSLLVGPEFPMDRAEVWAPFVCHELFHLWNGTTVGFDAQQYWWTEGATDYVTRVLLARDGTLPVPALLGDLRDRVRRTLGAGRSTSLRAAGEDKFSNHDLVYAGGSLAALCLDVRIREASGGKASLGDAMRDLVARTRGGSKRLSWTDIVDATSKAATVPTGPWLARHVAGTEPLPLETTFASLGLRLVVTTEEPSKTVTDVRLAPAERPSDAARAAFRAVFGQDLPAK